MNITAVILTYNEEIHLERCILSTKKIASRIIVVDSYSTDGTQAICEKHGASFIQHHWTNYATQFNWAITQADPDTDWILRIDADEFLSEDLIMEILTKMPNLPPSIDGVYWGRRMTFQGAPIRFGGLFPIRVLRLFRRGRGQCENRWMDEHIKVLGPTTDFKGEMIDDNKNSLTWWTQKHNQYASREAVDLLNLEFGFMPHDSVASLSKANQAGVKRWIKEVVYSRLPGGARAFLYFFYRFVLRFGFLDGRAAAFHVLQGLWYRYLVDAKIAEVKHHMQLNGTDVKSAIYAVLGIKV